MPPTNILITDVEATNTDKLHQVYVTDFNTVTQLGDDIDDTSLGAGSIGNRHQNLAIAAWGSVYCMSRRGIYRLQTGSQYGVWSNDPADGGYTFNSVYNNGRAWSGIYFMSIDNTPYLVGQYGDTTKSFRFNLLTSEGEEGAGSILGGTRHNGIIYSGIHYTADGIKFYSESFVTLTQERQLITPLSGPNSVTEGDIWDWNIFNGKLYAIGHSRIGGANNGLPTLYEFNSGMYYPIITDFESVITTYGNLDSRWCLFDDGTRMYAIYWDDQVAELGWNIWEINLVGNQLVKGNELTDTVLPAGLRPGGGSNTSSAWSVYKDLQSDGTADIYLIYSASSGAGTSTLYRFTNSTTELIPIASGIDSRYQFPNSGFGGGDRSVDITSPTVCVYARERDPLGEKVTFRAFPPLQPEMDYDGTNLIVNFYLASNYGTPTTAATLVGNVTGGSASRSLNSVLNVTTDGVTDYTAIISATNFMNLDNLNIVAEIV